MTMAIFLYIGLLYNLQKVANRQKLNAKKE